MTSRLIVNDQRKFACQLRHPQVMIRVSVSPSIFLNVPRTVSEPVSKKFGISLHAAFLREAHELGVSWPTVRSDTILAEPVLHVYLASLVEVHPPLLHDFEDLLLSLAIQPCPRVAVFHISSQVES